MKPKSRIILWLIILSGFLVRFWGINFGLPYIYQPDEGKLIYTTFYTASHWLRPDIFIHSILLPYFLIPVFGGYFLIGKLLGIFSSPFHFYVSYLSNPTIFVLLGRLFLVLISTGSLAVVYKIGKRFYGPSVGFLSAFFLSFSFLIVKESHYIKDEVLAAFFLCFFFYFLLLALTDKRLKDYFWASTFLGLAISAKYIYSPAFLVLLLTCYWGKRKAKEVLLISLLVILTFLITNPYVVLDFSRFYSQTRTVFLNQGGIINERTIWIIFLKEHLPNGLGQPLFFVSILGFLFSLSGIWGKKSQLLSFGIVLIFSGIIIGGSNFPRWAVPLFPFLCLEAALFLKQLFGKKKIILVGLSLMLALPNLLRIIKFNQLLTWQDTRTLAENWIEENISPETKIAIEGTQRDEIPSYLGPSLNLTKDRLEMKLTEAKKLGQKGENLQAQIEANRNKVSYDLIGITRLDYRFDELKNQYVEIENADYYNEEKVRYLITSSWTTRQGIGPKRKFMDSLESNYELIKEFRPTITMSDEPHGWRMDYVALDQVPLFQNGIFGPLIRIYRFK